MKAADHYLVFDVEATCSQCRVVVPRHEMEIIEFGAVLMHGKTLEVIDEFQSFVRPVRHPQLTPFCIALTSISQQDVDTASTFPSVLARLWQFAERGGQVTLGSWGSFDLRILERDCAFHQLPLPRFSRHLNLKHMFAARHNLHRGISVSTALQRVNLEFVGKLHRGLDDARNIAILARDLLAPQ